MKTTVITNEDFNGKKMFKIYAVDNEGERLMEYDSKTGEKKFKKPVVNIGLRKATLISENIDELKEFVIKGAINE